jgi:ATP-binding cassette, subfamily B, bacterial CvaB/MchF/RaxB
MPEELRFGRRPRLPVVLAVEAAECGLACLTMVARFHGHDIDLNGLRQRFALSLTGANLGSLITLADNLGLSPRALRAELAALKKVRQPAILHWDLNHFVVLAAATGKTVTIHDPALGKRTLPLEEVSKHFTGVVLELAPAAGFAPVTARAPMKLSLLWSKFSGGGSAFAQVILLSLALQIATFAAPFQLQLVVDEAIFRADADLLTVLALGFGALVLVQTGIEALRNYALRTFGHLLTFQVVGNLVRHLLRLPADFFEKRHVGDILSRLGSVQPIQEAVTRGVISAIIDGLTAMLAVVILFFYSTMLAFVVLAAVLLSLLFMVVLYPGYRARLEEEIIAKAKENSLLMETVRAATTIKLQGREPEREGHWRNYYAEVINSGMSVGKFQITQSFVQAAITGLQTVIVTYLAARMILRGEGFSIGMLFAFLSFRQTFTDRALGLINQAMQFRLLGLHLERLADIVTAAPDVSAEAKPHINMQGAIRLAAISFRYGAADPFVLEDVSLEITPGDFIAITGPSGSGKSTLLKLLLGLYPPTSGVIELDAQRATPELWRAWRTHVGVVMQDDKLLSGSLADNIAFFDPDLDMDRVVAAAKSAQVHEDIVHSPMQYLSLVGDMGTTLSAGQRQRVLLARALYRRPKLLILDEGTTNLDEETEALILDLIAGMPITRIVATHRLALLRRPSKVFRMQGRRLVDVRSAPRGSEAAEGIPAGQSPPLSLV